MATRDAETLTQLISERAGRRSESGSGKITFVALHERSIDPETEYQPSANLLWKISTGQDVKLTPALVRAIAAGLGLPLRRVQAAAAFQYAGYVSADLVGGTVVHEPGLTPDAVPKARALLEKWSEEEAGRN